MRIEYTLESADLEAFYLSMAKADPAVRRINGYIYGIVFVLFTLLCAWDAESMGSFLMGMISVVLFLAVWIAITAYLQPRLTRGAVRDMAKREMESHIGSQVVTLNDAGFEVATSVSTSFTKYEGVNRLEETDGLLLVFTSATSAQIIPKRAFRSDSERQEFWGMLKGKVESVTRVV